MSRQRPSAENLFIKDDERGAVMIAGCLAEFGEMGLRYQGVEQKVRETDLPSVLQGMGEREEMVGEVTGLRIERYGAGWTVHATDTEMLARLRRLVKEPS